VLNTYAVVGLLAMWARSWPAKRLLQAGIGLHLGLSAWAAWKLLSTRPRAAAIRRRPPWPSSWPGSRPTASSTPEPSPSRFARTPRTIWEFVFDAFTQWPQTWPLLVLSLMLIGMGLYKLGVLTARPRPGPIRA
jgi:uncharacterized protein